MRDLVAEVQLSTKDLVAPLFVREGITEAQPISSLEGVMQHTLASLRTEVKQLADLGVPAVILVQDFDFMGGSLGMAAGEAFITAAQLALARKL